jgi:hypothetical protein
MLAEKAAAVRARRKTSPVLRQLDRALGMLAPAALNMVVLVL